MMTRILDKHTRYINICSPLYQEMAMRRVLKQKSGNRHKIMQMILKMIFRSEPYSQKHQEIAMHRVPKQKGSDKYKILKMILKMIFRSQPYSQKHQEMAMQRVQSLITTLTTLNQNKSKKHGMQMILRRNGEKNFITIALKGQKRKDTAKNKF
jgi:hypothetical protein